MHEKKVTKDDDALKIFQRLKNRSVVIYLSLIGFFIYFYSLFNGFVWDDEGQITNNPIVQTLLNIPHFFTGGTYTSTSGALIGSYYRPLMLTFFSIFYNLFGAQPFPYHLFQVSLHIINAFLVFILFRQFFKNSLAFFFSCIFLVHPLNQAAVGYISHLQDVLFFFFGMSALIISRNPIKSIRHLICINIFLFLSFLSKETGLIFVPILILYQMLVIKKISRISLLSILATTALFLFIRFQIVHAPAIGKGLLVPIASESLPERLLSLPAICFYYLKIFFYPVHLAIDQLWVVKTIDFTHFYLPLSLDLLFLFILMSFGFYLYTSNKKTLKYYLFFTIWFFLGLIVHVQFFPLDQTVADHWFYFPMIGMLGILGTGFNVIADNKEIAKNVPITVAIVIITLLSIRTIVRNTDWQNNLTLYSHDIKFSPDSPRLESNLGIELMRIRQYSEAKRHFEHVTKLEPLWGSNWYNLGVSYEYSGNIIQAKTAYQKSIQVSQDVGGYINLGGSYLFYDNRPQSAIPILQEGIKKYPNAQRLHVLLAVAEYQIHNTNDALNEAKKAYTLSPNNEAKYVLNQIPKNLPIQMKYTGPNKLDRAVRLS